MHIIIDLILYVFILIDRHLRMTSRMKTAYFYDPDVGNFHYGMIKMIFLYQMCD